MGVVTFIWLSLIGICGIVNVTKYPGIFRAFDPSRAIMRKPSCFLPYYSPVVSNPVLYRSLCSHG